jgi:putative drug exporter of the RND superfamily
VRGLARWCIVHRGRVVVVWLVAAVLATVAAQFVGPKYVGVFSLPGTQSQQAADLLSREFTTQSGDADAIVFHVSTGTIDSPGVRTAMAQLLTRVRALPHVAVVVSPYSSLGAAQISPNRMTAFAAITYDKAASLLPARVAVPLLNYINAVHVPSLQISAGGQLVEFAEGVSVGPATEVGVIAALFILLITFGSLAAAGMPLITAGLGLITGVALLELATHVMDMPSVSPDLALMIGLGVGIDYSLFIVTRFRENYLALGDVERSIVAAMDTSGRAILLAGATVVIALLGMFATGIEFMDGLAVAAVIAVLMTLVASLTLLPALLSRFGTRLVHRGHGRMDRLFHRRAAPVGAARPHVEVTAPQRSVWRRWSHTVQAHPWPLTIVSLGVMMALLVPAFTLQLDNSDAGNDAATLSSRHAFDLLASGFGSGFNGPLVLVATLPPRDQPTVLSELRATLQSTPGIVAVTQAQMSRSGTIAVVQAYPDSAPQALATTNLVNHLRDDVLSSFERRTGVPVLVGGFTAASIDFSHVLAGKLPLFLAIVILFAAVLLLVIFRSLVIPVQAAIMNLLTIGAALGVTVAVFQWGWFASVLGVQPGPIEPWMPVIMFAIVFGLSMDYEVFLVSRVREQWTRKLDASAAVTDGIALTGRVISAAAAIMVCVFLSFTLGNDRTLKEFGFGLAVAVFLDALVVRCVLLPAVLELLGPATWWLPRRLDARLPHINIDGSAAREIEPEGIARVA